MIYCVIKMWDEVCNITRKCSIHANFIIITYRMLIITGLKIYTNKQYHNSK